MSYRIRVYQVRRGKPGGKRLLKVLAEFGPFFDRQAAEDQLPQVTRGYPSPHYKVWVVRDQEDGPEENPAEEDFAHVFHVVKREGHYWIEGLPDGRKPDTFLIVVYDAGDADVPYNAKLMHHALYDIWQISDELAKLSRNNQQILFKTPFGNYVGQGLHVEPLVSYEDSEEDEEESEA